MTPSTVDDRHRIENTFFRTLFTRLQSLTPPESPTAPFLEAARPFFDPDSTDSLPPVPIASVDDGPLEDPVTAVIRRDPQASALATEQSALTHDLRHRVSADAWRTFLAFEEASNERMARLESIVFDHGFRLGQVYPVFPRTAEATRDPVLRRLARAATDLSSPPGQRLRVLMAAAIQALEELLPAPST